MLFLGAFATGAALGAYRANKRGGGTKDQLQWGAAHGLLFFVLAMVAVTFAAS